MIVYDNTGRSKVIYWPIVPATVAVVGLLVGASQSEQENSVNLEQYKWKNRLMFLFAPNRDHPSFESLHVSIVAREADVDERDLVIFEVLEAAPSTVDGDPLDPASARQLRERFGVPAGAFGVILVGKDGGVKLDRQDRTSLEEIFALIDSMPMRQEEMRRENS
jgi:hypothetical protein